MGDSHRIDGRTIHGATLLLVAVAIGSAFLLGADASERALLAARYTARAAFAVFVLVYVAGPGARLWPNAVFRRLAASRRQLGLACAMAMTFHLAALAINVGLYRPRPLASLAPGAVIYAFILAMVLTSSDRAQRRLGKRWRIVHAIGINAILLGFLNGYAGRLFKPDYFITGAVFTPVVVLIVALRLWAMKKRRVSGLSAATAP